MKHGKVMRIALVLVLLMVLSLLNLTRSAWMFVGQSKKLANAATSQDLAAIKKELANEKRSLMDLRISYVFTSWTRIVPVLGSYSSDANHAINAADLGLQSTSEILDIFEPYADVIGLTKDNGTQTTQERIDKIARILPEVAPKIEKVTGKITLIQKEVAKIDPKRYPVKFANRPLRDMMTRGISLVDQLSIFAASGTPLLQEAPYLLGLDSPRTYLVLFQNDKELRPTGGFLTAYSIMKVANAKFEPVISSDIYNLDASYKGGVDAPSPLIKYIKGPYVLSRSYRLRDMNWSPDFKQSMDLFLQEATKAGLNQVDGIIAVDTHLLVNLIDVTGPIDVPDFGTFSTKIVPECNCPQVIHELESFADVEGPVVWDPVTGKIIYRPPNSENRKKIIGPLMNTILASVMGLPKERFPELFQAGFKSLFEKDVLLYVTRGETQRALESFSVAGRIKDYDGDYLHINDANLGGRKSNLYVTQEVNQEIDVDRAGNVIKTVTITYKNPERQDGWLNSVLPNWVRVYVPKGSTLLSSDGLEEKESPYEDLGKTVFAGFFQLRPEGVSKISFRYKLPFKVNKEYKILIQKQPGTSAFLHSIEINNRVREIFLNTDKELTFPL